MNILDRATLTVRNNSQMLLIVASIEAQSRGEVSGTFEISDMESFALEFDGMLLTYVEKTEVHNNEYSQYNYHPAINSNTIHHKAWLI